MPIDPAERGAKRRNPQIGEQEVVVSIHGKPESPGPSWD
jgi:hypothetical protein